MKQLLLICSLLIVPVASAQIYDRGFPPYGSFQDGRLDTVNLQNLNAFVSIPVVSVPARGMNFGLSIGSNSAIWEKFPLTPPSWQILTAFDSGWVTDPVGDTYFSHDTTITDNTACFVGTRYGQTTTENFYGFEYIDIFQTRHSFSVEYHRVTYDECEPWYHNPYGTSTGRADDGSGYSIDITTPDTPIVYSKSGVAIKAGITPTGFPSSYKIITDPNGNIASSAAPVSGEIQWTDSSGRTALRIVKVGANTEYHYLDATGADQKYTLRYSDFDVRTNFACPNFTDYNQSGLAGYRKLPVALDLPNGRGYVFEYEPTPGFTQPTPPTPQIVTARLKTVTLPTGGYYGYAYPGANGGMNCDDGSTLRLTRTISDGTTIATWEYSRSPLAGGVSDTTVTAPALPYDGGATNKTTYRFDSKGHETSQWIYQGAGITRTIHSAWTSPPTGTPATPLSRTTYLEDSVTQSRTESSYDALTGNLLNLKEYDWGVNAPGPLLRNTTYDYVTDVNYTTITRNLSDLLLRKTIQDGSAVQFRQLIGYDETPLTSCPAASQHTDNCALKYRGNPTTITTYKDPVGPSLGVTKNFSYDWFGNVTLADVNCCQKKTFNYSTTTNYSFPDSIVRGTGTTTLSTSATYNTWTGQVMTQTDENGKQTSYAYADPMKRISSITRPDTAQITYAYNDTNRTVTTTSPLQGTSTVTQTVSHDGLGQPTLTAVTGGSKVQTTYDPVGRVYQTSNPFTGTSTSYFTTNKFDALGRPTAVVLPDSGQTNYSYSTNTVTVTDPALKQRKSQSDAVGRLVKVFEPDVTQPGNPLTQQTLYTYTVLDSLQTVTQGVQTRTYGYDNLGRLKSVKTPETNQLATTYDYNDFDLPITRTDPRGVITNYGYDGLNRLYNISYNVGTTGVPATPGVTFSYGTDPTQNNNGRILTMTDGPGSETYKYDILGQVKQVDKVISGITYTTLYDYNLAGEITKTTYPSGRAVTPGYDAIGRLSGISDTLNAVNTTYASGFTYNDAQQVIGFTYGNGINAAFGYAPDRLQLQCLDYSATARSQCVHDATTKFGLSYWYKQDATNCPSAPAGNNGQIQCIADSVDSGRSAVYTYDPLSRLSTAVTNGSVPYPKWGLSWTYDRYGNRSDQNQTFGNPPTTHIGIDAATNRISGFTFDLNGNLTAEPAPASYSYVYDAENRLVSSTNGFASGNYTYDGSGLRVKKVAGTTTTVYIFSGSKVIAEYDGSGGIRNEYLYAGGTRLASVGNIISNGGFEDGPVGWAFETGAQIITDAMRAHSGNKYVQISTSTEARATATAYVPVSPGDQISFGGWAYRESGTSGYVRWKIYTYDAAQTIIDAPDPSPNDAGAAWTLQLGSYTIPANIAYVRLYCEVWNVTGPTVGRCDDGFLSTGQHYYHADHLSARLITNSSGTKIGEQGHYSFGDAWYSVYSVSGDSDKKFIFTTYERDSESGNDYAMARFYISRLGRFSCPDPVAGDISDPQSLNLYTYVRNDPEDITDPSGEFWGFIAKLVHIIIQALHHWYVKAAISAATGRPVLFPGGASSVRTPPTFSRGDGFDWNLAFFPDRDRRLRTAPTFGRGGGGPLDLIKQAISSRPDCAALIGGIDRGLRMIAKTRFSDVSAPSWRAPNALQADQTWFINSGRAYAAVDVKVAVSPAAHSGPLFAKWNGGPFSVLYGTDFKNMNAPHQAGIVMHEFMHVNTVGNPMAQNPDFRPPGHSNALSMEVIEERCGFPQPE